MVIFLGPFSGHDFGQQGVRPNCRASPLLAKNCDQKMVTVLGTAGGRLDFEPRIRARKVVTDPGGSFGLGLGVGFWPLGCGPNCGHLHVCTSLAKAVLGIAGGRLQFESRIRARYVVTAPGPSFGLGLRVECVYVCGCFGRSACVGVSPFVSATRFFLKANSPTESAARTGTTRWSHLLGFDCSTLCSRYVKLPDSLAPWPVVIYIYIYIGTETRIMILAMGEARVDDRVVGANCAEVWKADADWMLANSLVLDVRHRLWKE